MGSDYVVKSKAPPSRLREGGLHSLGWSRVIFETSTLESECVLCAFDIVLFSFYLQFCRAAKGMFYNKVMYMQGIT